MSSASCWHHVVLHDIEARLSGDSLFPCVFSKNAFKKKLIKFIFVENLGAGDMAQLAAALVDYVNLSKDWDGSLDTAFPLIIAFSKSAVYGQTIEEYHRAGWKILEQLHEADPAPWPTHINRDANSPEWSMCFNAMPLFVNMSGPLHLIRKSRNLGEHFVFVVNPRERFDVFAGNTAAGQKVRANIRTRIARFDGMTHALQLGTYNAGSCEWWQYSLVEENVERTDRCPFIANNARGNAG